MQMTRMDVNESQTVDLREFKRFATFVPVDTGEVSHCVCLFVFVCACACVCMCVCVF